MTKNTANIRRRDAENRFLTKKTAEIAGVSVSMVEKVMRMEKDSPRVVTAFMTLREGIKKIAEEFRQVLPDIDPAPAPKPPKNAISERVNRAYMPENGHETRVN